MAMIKEKLKGHKPIVAAAPERGNVINLMDALKASLSQAKPPAEEQEPRPSRPRQKAAAKAPTRRAAKKPARKKAEVTAASRQDHSASSGALAAFPRRLAAREVAAPGRPACAAA